MEKFLDVDVLEAMRTIAGSTLAPGTFSSSEYKEVILEIMRKRPENREPLLWVCVPGGGTALYPLRDAFKCGSLAYEDLPYYQNRALSGPIAVYYEIDILEKRDGVVRGNIYAVDGSWFTGLTRASTPDLTDADIKAEQQVRLERYFEVRNSFPETDLIDHLERQRAVRIKSEAKRVVEILKGMEMPNIPGTAYASIVLSDTFLEGAGEGDLSKLNDELGRISSGPACFIVYNHDVHRCCAAKVCYESVKQKRSVKEQLAQKPVSRKQAGKKPKGQEER